MEEHCLWAIQPYKQKEGRSPTQYVLVGQIHAPSYRKSVIQEIGMRQLILNVGTSLRFQMSMYTYRDSLWKTSSTAK